MLLLLETGGELLIETGGALELENPGTWPGLLTEAGGNVLLETGGRLLLEKESEPPPPDQDYFLMENGFALLLEDGANLLLEAPVAPPQPNQDFFLLETGFSLLLETGANLLLEESVTHPKPSGGGGGDFFGYRARIVSNKVRTEAIEPVNARIVADSLSCNSDVGAVSVRGSAKTGIMPVRGNIAKVGIVTAGADEDTFIQDDEIAVLLAALS